MSDKGAQPPFSGAQVDLARADEQTSAAQRPATPSPTQTSEDDARPEENPQSDQAARPDQPVAGPGSVAGVAVAPGAAVRILGAAADPDTGAPFAGPGREMGPLAGRGRPTPAPGGATAALVSAGPSDAGRDLPIAAAADGRAARLENAPASVELTKAAAALPVPPARDVAATAPVQPLTPALTPGILRSALSAAPGDAGGAAPAAATAATPAAHPLAKQTVTAQVAPSVSGGAGGAEVVPSGATSALAPESATSEDGPPPTVGAAAVTSAPAGGAVASPSALPAAVALPPSVSQQIVTALHQPADGRVDVALSPEELGRVRLSLSIVDGGIVVHVAAERPETLALLRRHIDLLAQDFRALGYESVDFGFSDRPGAQGDSGHDGPDPGLSGGHPAHGAVVAVTTPEINLTAAWSGGLDLRL